MKHVGLLLAALLCDAFAGVAVWYNRTHLSVSVLAFALVLIVLGFLFAAPANAKDALTTLAPFATRFFPGGAGDKRECP